MAPDAPVPSEPSRAQPSRQKKKSLWIDLTEGEFPYPADGAGGVVARRRSSQRKSRYSVMFNGAASETEDDWNEWSGLKLLKRHPKSTRDPYSQDPKPTRRYDGLLGCSCPFTGGLAG